MTTTGEPALPHRPWAAPSTRLEPLIELDRLAVAVRLGWRRCLVGALVGVALGLAVPRVLGGGPAATAGILVGRGDQPGPLDSYSDKAAMLAAGGADVRPDMLPSTGMALCAGSAVAGPAAAALGIEPAAMLGSYTCSDAASNLIRITVHGRTPEQAERAAGALAEAFLAAYRTAGQQTADAQYTDLLAQRGRIESDLAEVTRSLAAATYPAQIQSLEGLQRGLLTRIDDLTARATNRQTAAATTAAGSRIVDLAVNQAGNRKKLLAPVAGGGLGLGLGIVSIALGAVVRDRPLRRREVAAALGEPIALDISRTRHGYRSDHDVSAAAAVLARLVRNGTAVAVLESGAPKVALALTAAAAEQLGAAPRTRVCGTLRRPGAAFDRLAGLVDLIPAGEPYPDPDAQITVASLRPRGAWIGVAAGAELALLLVRAGHETEEALRASTDDLAQAGIPVAAVFLVDPDRHDRSDGFAAEAFGRLIELQRGAAI